MSTVRPFATIGLVLIVNFFVRAAPPPAASPVFEPADPTPQAGEESFAVEFSRNGKLLAVAHGSRSNVNDCQIVVYDTTTWKVAHALNGPTQRSHSLAFSANGETLFAGSFDGKLYSWDTTTGKAGRTLDLDAGMCMRVLVSPDGKYLVGGYHDNRKQPGNARLQLWDAATFKPLRSMAELTPQAAYTAAFTPDGKALAANQGKWDAGPEDFNGIVEYEIESGKERKRYDAVRVTAGAHPIICRIVFSPDGKRMYVGGGEAVPANGNANVTSLHAYLWAFEYPSGKLLKTVIEDRHDYVRNLTVSPDGSKVFATTGTGPKNVVFPNGGRGQKLFGEVHAFETEGWKPLWTIETNDHHHWASLPSPGGKRVVVSDEEGVRFLDSTTGAKRGALLTVGKGR